MSLPRKHIAEGIATALMVGVGGVRGALANRDRWTFGEPYLFVAGHALPNPSEEDVRMALASPIVQPMRQIAGDRRVAAGEVERMFTALRKGGKVV